ncbi:ABC transporter permease [Cryobacterium sp. TMT1-21]|uniref:ABC transporter permease n=1 Tax=Cryobacterium shii TaxID=1259235 RepID=A0AAQ2C586_9MICO|nr:MULTISPECIES: ABC transporter permease [Cryobacterium]TFC44381.1 ABC transporter permease [Cryobacterium shii]TFC88451.1 ABC transporter permease [Cryobacterium sp. TmT2-59]TFD17931.1 ABC transporter permease [Cryobacterium sp. TMT1-21]TFD18926.1 ABC transporter permease [Cryobacterium sp. TMT2-23]TFD35766.1 ABC transporter permease [Cryobacterium sp. TMT2-10]
MSRFFQRMGPLGSIAVGFVALVVLGALLAPIIAPYDPTIGSVTQRYQGPSMAHLLGTDQAGRDIFSRLLWGARSSLTGPLIVVVITAVFGTTLALTSVWWGGIVDSFMSRVLDLLFAFPNLLLAMLAIAVFGPSLTTAALALSIAYIPYTARVIRSTAMRERNLPYTRSPQLQGISGVTITTRHLLPNVAPLIVTGATINFGFAMIELAALSFLGLGVQPPQADWGLMVSNGQQSLLKGYPAESVLAGLCIVLTVAALGYIGERLGGRAAAGRKA